VQVIYGINPLLEILLSDPAVVEKVILAEGRSGGPAHKLLMLAREHGIPVEFGEREKVERLAPGRVHQGIVGLCRDHAYASLDDVVANRHPRSRFNLVILLDSITDPQNLGSIIRTAHSCGANGVVIPENRAVSLNATVAKVSAGADRLLPTAMVTNLARTIDTLKERGFWIYGADATASSSIHEPDYEGHVGLVMGSEGKGIRPLVRKKCDFLISIPMRGQVSSLNVSVATGVILYEILRKWGEGS